MMDPEGGRVEERKRPHCPGRGGLTIPYPEI